MSEFLYSTIVARGRDAFDFLQAQLAADLHALHADDVLLSAWCNPKGRVICLLHVATAADGFSLALPEELAADVATRLASFRFRAKVEFEIRSANREELGMQGTLDEWRHANLVNGIAEIGRRQSEAFTPHMLNFDLFGAVSLDKGCYPGQEIVARTHYRGASRRRCLRFESAIPVSAGQKVSDGTQDVGDVLNAIGTDLLAVVPVGYAGELRVNGDLLQRRPLPYL